MGHLHCALVFLASLPLVVHTSIFRVTATDSTRAARHIESFGFIGWPLSNFTLLVHQLSATTNSSEGPVGFALEIRDSKFDARHRQYRKHKEECFLDTPVSRRLLAVLPGSIPESSDVRWLHLQSRGDPPQVIDWSKELHPPGLYSLYFFDCSHHHRHSFDIEVHEFNERPDGTRLYLPVGDQPLPLLHLCFALAMAVGAWRWRSTLVAHRSQVKAVHVVMFLVPALAAISFASAALYFSAINHTGHASYWVANLYHLPRALGRILTLLTVALLGFHWSLGVRPLTASQKFLLFGVVTMTSISSLFWAISTETNEGNPGWPGLRRAWRLTGGIATILALYPLIRGVYPSLKAQVAAAVCYCCCPPCTALYMWLQKGVSQSEARHRCWVCVTVMGGFFVGNVGVLAEVFLPYNLVWLGALLRLSSQFAFYALMAYLLHPARHIPDPTVTGAMEDDLVLSDVEDHWGQALHTIVGPTKPFHGASESDDDEDGQSFPPANQHQEANVTLAACVNAQHLVMP